MKMMSEKASPHDEVVQALPAVREALRAEIANRRATGEMIAYAQDDGVVASRPATRDLAMRRAQLLEEFSKRQTAPKAKSAA